MQYIDIIIYYEYTYCIILVRCRMSSRYYLLSNITYLFKTMIIIVLIGIDCLLPNYYFLWAFCLQYIGCSLIRI